ncbi:HK97 gp10 family phage protein [Mesorhizobium mediterraneum]|uniref:HK97 gp10 family phage protein n=1 Tax=Mesorhizobium mediterraneum TaxID=43617 RepID=A0AB36QZI8_9HYPH|nr:HK97 gp10 family phage protein [Mesorhizobium mediterraneum]PAP97819.1 hypothetical protein CIT25_35115 [Mesorhizobium mediterraneum]WIW52050.1 HK97 gp10 family phage protein [Mesorhizobium mediterraneum]
MIDGLKKLEQKLARMSRPSKTEIRGALTKGADRIANLARNLVPVEDGDLKRSIRTEQGRHELAMDVKAGGDLTQRPVRTGVTAPEFDYAGAVEGKSPYFFPAYRAVKKSVQRDISKAIKNAASLDSKS